MIEIPSKILSNAEIQRILFYYCSQCSKNAVQEKRRRHNHQTLTNENKGFSCSSVLGLIAKSKEAMLKHRGTDFAGKSQDHLIMAPGSRAKADTMLAQI